MHSLGIIQLNFTRQDHLGYPGRVSGTGPVNTNCWVGYLNISSKKSTTFCWRNSITAQAYLHGMLDKS